jgi:long-chain acyl-CoA synthetase
VLLVERFDPSSAVEAIQNHGVTVLAGAPTMWATWAAMPDLADDSFATVKVAMSGAAALDPQVARRCASASGWRWARATASPRRRRWSPPPSACRGVRARWAAPLDGVEVRLVDVDGEDALVGDPGEIWVRGPNVFQGYWNDAEATRRPRRARAGSTPATSPWSTTTA